MAYLILVRHGESEWNAKGLWAGLTDVSLTLTGAQEAGNIAASLADYKIDRAYTSELKRAQETLSIIKKNLGWQQLPTIQTGALNERDYGSLTGKNKWDIKKKYGEEQFLLWRRSWDGMLPGGESLKDVYNRVVPFYLREIKPKLQKGENILIVAHGNSLRALIKLLNKIPDDNIASFELGTGETYIYSIDTDGRVLQKEVKHRKSAQ